MRGSTWDAISDAKNRMRSKKQREAAKETEQSYGTDPGWWWRRKARTRRLLQDLNRILHRDKVKATKRHHKGGRKHMTYYERQK